MILSGVACNPKNRSLLLLDITGAFLYGRMRREVAIRLPRECNAPLNHVGLLNKSLYGLRDAPQIWQEHFSNALVQLGFEVAPTTVGLMRHTEKGIVLACHVDDVIAAGCLGSLEWLSRELKKIFELKCELLGESHGKTGKIPQENYNEDSPRNHLDPRP